MVARLEGLGLRADTRRIEAPPTRSWTYQTVALSGSLWVQLGGWSAVGGERGAVGRGSCDRDCFKLDE